MEISLIRLILYWKTNTKPLLRHTFFKIWDLQNAHPRAENVKNSTFRKNAHSRAENLSNSFFHEKIQVQKIDVKVLILGHKM